MRLSVAVILIFDEASFKHRDCSTYRVTRVDVAAAIAVPTIVIAVSGLTPFTGASKDGILRRGASVKRMIVSIKETVRIKATSRLVPTATALECLSMDDEI